MHAVLPTPVEGELPTPMPVDGSPNEDSPIDGPTPMPVEDDLAEGADVEPETNSNAARTADGSSRRVVSIFEPMRNI